MEGTNDFLAPSTIARTTTDNFLRLPPCRSSKNRFCSIRFAEELRKIIIYPAHLAVKSQLAGLKDKAWQAKHGSSKPAVRPVRRISETSATPAFRSTVWLRHYRPARANQISDLPGTFQSYHTVVDGCQTTMLWSKQESSLKCTDRNPVTQQSRPPQRRCAVRNACSSNSRFGWRGLMFGHIAGRTTDALLLRL